LNTSDRAVSKTPLESELMNEFETEIRVTATRDEERLLDAVAEFLAQEVAPRDYLLVAYNGERFRGGFDLPFLRTRYARQDKAWPFDSIPYADILPLVQDRFNTTQGGDQHNDLVAAYETLIGGEFSTLDPFADSSEAVTAYENGAFEDLLAHNLADICRTKALASLAERYCSKTEFNLKSLTPSARDPALSPSH
jgi:hypothetical protein